MPTPEDIQRKKDFLALFAPPRGGAKPKREVAVERVKDRLRGLAETPDGLQKIDAMVEAIGPKAKNDESRAVIAEALKVRFNLESVSGDLSTKALPRLYHVFKMVPEAHVRDNDKLLNVVRNSRKNTGGIKGWIDHVKTEGGLGFYKPDTGRIDVNIPKVGIPFARKDGAGNLNVYEAFDFTTLHEIGHAVDAKLKFMDRSGATRTTGAWKEENPRSIAEVGVARKGLGAAFPAVPTDSLETYLAAVLEGTAPAEAAASVVDRIQTARAGLKSAKDSRQEFLAVIGRMVAINKRIAAEESEEARLELRKDRMKIWIAVRGRVGAELGELAAPYLTPAGKVDTAGLEAAVGEALVRMEAGTSPGVGPDVADRLVAHPATAWAQGLRMRTGLNGLWDDDEESARLAVDGRVYQQAYAHSWVSYSLEARSKKVSGYQFRAPGEWFAELYACYYLRKPARHPHYGWFATLIDKGGFAPPADPE